MSHAHAPRRHPGQPAPGHPVHVQIDQAGQSETFAVPVPGRALPGAALPASGAAVIRRLKDDAVQYVDEKGIDIKVSQQTVEEYVNDTDNDEALRLGLLEAWNLNNSTRWTIETPADLRQGNPNPYHYSNFQPYQDFTKTTTGVSVTAYDGPVSAYYNRGAPKLGSQSKNWGNTKLGDTYVEFIRGLRSGGRSDKTIARALLELDDTVLASHLEKRAAAMMTLTVYLAEEWRKQGAAKIYRAILRLIVLGKRDFDDFLDDFKFIGSADLGRKQVARFYDVWLGDSDRTDMDTDEGEIYDQMSEMDDDDMSSDDDMRTDDKKNIDAKRLYAKKHRRRR